MWKTVNADEPEAGERDDDLRADAGIEEGHEERAGPVGRLGFGRPLRVARPAVAEAMFACGPASVG